MFTQNERVNKEEQARRAQLALDKANVELIEKEEIQFQEYAKKVRLKKFLIKSYDVIHFKFMYFQMLISTCIVCSILQVIDHCKEGGRNVYPLEKAARWGSGGGSGPNFPGKAGVRPSYMVSDKSGVQMPHFQNDTTEESKLQVYGKTPSKNRLGFVW